MKAPRHMPLCEEFTDDRWAIPAQRASNAENVSIWWRHHGNSFSFHRLLFRTLTEATKYTYLADTAKLTGPRTFADKRWVGLVKLLCIIMFNISKIRPKSLFGPVKAQKFSRCLIWSILSMLYHQLYLDHISLRNKIWFTVTLWRIGWRLVTTEDKRRPVGLVIHFAGDIC